MKKILNIVLGDMSTGELAIAMSFCRNHSLEEYEHSFLIPEEKEKIMDKNINNVFSLSKKNTSIENQNKVKQIISELHPDLIILFDIFTYEYAQNWTGCNTGFLKEFNIPLASIDEYEYTRTNLKIDYYGIFVKKLPALFNKCDYILKNCPLTMPKSIEVNNNKEYYYRVFQEFNCLSDEERILYRQKYFKLDDIKTKVVFFTTSYWEVSGAYSFSCQDNLAKCLGPIVYNYLNDLDKDILLVHIGNENWDLKSNGKVKYLHFESLKSTDFDNMLQASDIFLTYNIVSISLSKAVLYGIPSLVLNNQKIIEFNKLSDSLKKKPEWYQNIASYIGKVYPFSASMFGWNNFLKTCLNNNLYLETFITANVFNYNKTLDAFRQILFDDDFCNKLRRRNDEFINQYKLIASSEEVLAKIFDGEKDNAR